MRESFTKICSSVEGFGDFRGKVKNEIKSKVKSYLSSLDGDLNSALPVSFVDAGVLADIVIRVELILYGTAKIGRNEKRVITIEDINYSMSSPKFPHHEVYSDESKNIESFIRFNFAKKWGIPSLIISDLMSYFQLKSILEEGYLYFSLRDGISVNDDILKTPVLGNGSSIVTDVYSNSEHCLCRKIDRRQAYSILLGTSIYHNMSFHHMTETKMVKWDKASFEAIVGVKPKSYDGESDVINFRPGYNSLIKADLRALPEKIESGQIIVKTTGRDRESIRINLNELREYVISMNELDEHGKWLYRYEKIRFFDTTLNRNVEEICIEDISHWIGLPNVGKTTIMTILAGFLTKVKGIKVALILRENSDVDGVSNSLIKCGVKAQPFVGSDLDKYYKNRVSRLKYVENILDDNILPFYENSCKLKDMLDLNIENMGNMKKEDLCFKLCVSERRNYASNLQRDYKGEYACPYIMECPKYHSKHIFKDSEVYLTNIHSFIMTLTTKTIFKERVTSLELLAKECDVILIDEADNMQEIIESLFVDEEFIVEGREKGLLELTIDSVEQGIKGKKARFRGVTRWLLSARNCVAASEEILHLLSEDVLPKKMLKGSFTSRKLFRMLSSKMIDGVGFRSNIDEDEDDDMSEENDILIDEKKKDAISFYNNYLDKFYMAYSGEKSLIQDELINKMIRASYCIVGAGKEDFFELIEDCFDDFVVRFEILIRNQNESDKKRVESYVKMFQLIIAVSAFEVYYNYTQINIDKCKEFIDDKDLLKNIGYASSFLRHYEGLIPKASAGGQYGLSYHDDNGRRSLKLNKYGNVGRYLLYNIHNLFKSIDGIATARTVLLSATSYMPHSLNYHIDIKPRYILENSDTSNLSISYKKMFLEDEFGDILRLSGCVDKERDKVLKAMSKDLCAIKSNGLSKLDKVYNTTSEGRRRVAFTVGSFEEAVMFYWNLERELGRNGLSGRFNLCIIVGDETKYRNSGLNVFPKSNLDKFHESPYNLAIIVTKSLERGINILTADDVAAFSTLVYIKRPYLIPENMVDLVSILNNNAISYYNMSYTKAIDVCEGQYSISKFAKALIGKTHQLQDKFYNRTFYSLIEDDSERLNIISNLLVSTHQLEGRFYRGNVSATIIYTDGAFFPKEAKGERQEESYKTSIVEGFKWYFSLFEQDNTPEGIQVRNIMNKLYGFRAEALENINYI